MSWHTKYRPKKIADLHLTSVRQTLQKMMESGKFPQVFLCAGPKGTGKTSTSRIIGAMLNDQQNKKVVTSLYFDRAAQPGALKDPKSDSDLAASIFAGNSYLVQELDAASNRGIDDVRALKEQAVLPPQQGLIAVYILDEVHMLTNEAFNALLKLLEEPPAHAVFILATTELHKVPQTIQSRCTLLNFKKASSAELTTAIEKVVAAESISIEPAAITAIADEADGSFRDAIKLLELVTATESENISLATVQHTLQTGFTDQIPKLLAAVVAKDEQKVVSILMELREMGVASNSLHKALLTYLHRDLLLALGVETGEPAQFSEKISHFLLSQLEQLPVVAVHVIPLLAIELKLLDIVFKAQSKAGGKPAGGGGSTRATKTQVQQQAKPQAAVQKKAVTAEPDLVSDFVAADANDNLQTLSHQDSKPLLDGWVQFVNIVEAQNSTVAALLRSAKPLPAESNGVAKVEVYYSFHRDQLMQPKFMSMLQNCAEGMIGHTPTFEFVLNKSANVPVITTQSETLSVLPKIIVKNESSNQEETVVPAKDLAALAGQALM
jgi:DNA polymerase III subunit gamma/tau